MSRALLLLLLLGGPALAQGEPCPFVGQTPRLVVRLYLGGSMQGRGTISRRAWERFVADTVTPALPRGFTVYDAYGQWMDPATRVIGREATEVIEVAEADTPEFRARVAGIADAYRRRFEQHTVGLVSELACAAF